MVARGGLEVAIGDEVEKMAGGGGGNAWMVQLGVGGTLLAAAFGLEAAGIDAHWAHLMHAGLLAIGGLLVVFGSCEAMILSVEGIGERLDWNQFVAGTMGGLASNIPELVMLGFVLAAQPRIGFVVVALALHVGAMTFGIYSALLPRDDTGHAELPEPLVKISTDLYAGACGVYVTMGLLMLCMRAFESGEHAGQALNAQDLLVMGAALLAVEVVAIRRLVTRFSGSEDDVAEAMPTALSVEKKEPPSWGVCLGYGAMGIVASIIGGHAVGEFADVLQGSLRDAGYPEMIGALLISVFACSGQFVMIATAHRKGMYDIALASASGGVTQVPFVVQPVAFILLGIFAYTGVVPGMSPNGALPIDLETTGVILLGFPPMLVLWKAVQDDGKVNWVETAVMCCIFGLVLYFLAEHGSVASATVSPS